MERQPESPWQPIETAPKDEIIDLWVEFPECGEDPAHSLRWADCHWDRVEGDWRRAGGLCLHQFIAKPSATHWMRHPAGPDGQEG